MFEVGMKIRLDGIEYKIIGDDTGSDAHPAGHKTWDYLLEANTGKIIKTTKKDLERVEIIGRIG